MTKTVILKATQKVKKVVCSSGGNQQKLGAVLKIDELKMPVEISTKLLRCIKECFEIQNFRLKKSFVGRVNSP